MFSISSSFGGQLSKKLGRSGPEHYVRTHITELHVLFISLSQLLSRRVKIICDCEISEYLLFEYLLENECVNAHRFLYTVQQSVLIDQTTPQNSTLLKLC